MIGIKFQIDWFAIIFVGNKNCFFLIILLTWNHYFLLFVFNSKMTSSRIPIYYIKDLDEFDRFIQKGIYIPFVKLGNSTRGYSYLRCFVRHFETGNELQVSYQFPLPLRWERACSEAVKKPSVVVEIQNELCVDLVSKLQRFQGYWVQAAEVLMAGPLNGKKLYIQDLSEELIIPAFNAEALTKFEASWAQAAASGDVESVKLQAKLSMIWVKEEGDKGSSSFDQVLCGCNWELSAKPCVTYKDGSSEPKRKRTRIMKVATEPAGESVAAPIVDEDTRMVC